MNDEDTDEHVDASAIDWSTLRARALDAAQRAHAPYSKLGVGAAGVGRDTDAVIIGCNVENASYGLGMCAECGLVSAAQIAGVRLVAVSMQSNAGDVLMPCGRCRQVLLEAGGLDLLVDADPAPLRLSALLPHAFTSDQLP